MLDVIHLATAKRHQAAWIAPKPAQTDAGTYLCTGQLIMRGGLTLAFA